MAVGAGTVEVGATGFVVAVAVAVGGDASAVGSTVAPGVAVDGG